MSQATAGLPRLVPYRLYFRGRAHVFRVRRAIAMDPLRDPPWDAALSDETGALVQRTLRCLDYTTAWLTQVGLVEADASNGRLDPNLLRLQQDAATITEFLVRDLLGRAGDPRQGLVVVGYHGAQSQLDTAAGVPFRVAAALDRAWDAGDARRHRALLQPMVGESPTAVA